MPRSREVLNPIAAEFNWEIAANFLTHFGDSVGIYPVRTELFSAQLSLEQSIALLNIKHVVLSRNPERVSKAIPRVSFMQILGNFFGGSHRRPFAKIALTFQPSPTYVLLCISLHKHVTPDQSRQRFDERKTFPAEEKPWLYNKIYLW